MQPSTTYKVRFLIRNDMGALDTPTGDVTATLFRNGNDTAVDISLSAVSTGRYTAEWTNGAWADGDVLQLEISSVSGSITTVEIVWEGSIRIGGGGLDAAGVRAALGMSTADMDDQLDAILAASGGGGLDAAGIRAALGMTAADLDAQLDAIFALGGGGLDAAGVRAALGMSTADMDDQLDAILAASNFEQTLPDALASAFIAYLSLPFFPVQGAFSFIEGDDHQQDNQRGAIGPFEVETPIKLSDAAVTMRSGFTQKRGIRYDGAKFNGGAYYELIDGETYDGPGPYTYNAYITVDGSVTHGQPSGVYGVDIDAMVEIEEGNVDKVTIMRTEADMLPDFGLAPEHDAD
jgi:hypothetical protein